MSDNTQALALTQSVLNSVEKTKDILELPAVADNWVRTYNKTSGRDDGEMRHEAEKILFMQTVGTQKALDKCDKFSLYAAWIELSISGLTLRDGITYIIPYGKKAQFQVGWRGRLEQINELPDVVFCHEPVVVYNCDVFDYERGRTTKINTHKPGALHPRTKASIPTHVYFVIEFSHGPEVYLMEAIDVLNIRDNYSDSYNKYVDDCKAANKEIGDTFKVMKQYGQSAYEVEVEPPMWITDEAQAFKKTIVKRTWGTLPKLPKQKWLDEQMATRAKQSGNINFDADEAAREVFKQPAPVETAEIDFTALTQVADDDTPITSHEEIPADTGDNSTQGDENAPVIINQGDGSGATATVVNTQAKNRASTTSKKAIAADDAKAGLNPSKEFDTPAAEAEKPAENLAAKFEINLDEEYN